LVGISFAVFAGKWDGMVSVLVLLTTLFLQILSNLANDYGDFIKNTDNEERVGESRSMQSGLIGIGEMKIAILVFALLSFVTGISLLLYRLWGLSAHFSLFLLLGLGAILAALKYTLGKTPYGYKALGDVFVFLFFGPVAIGGTFFLNTLSFESTILFPAAAMGFFSVAVLNINNMRDIASDKKAKKITIPVLWGLQKAKIYHFTLILLAFVFLSIFVLIHHRTYYQALFLLSIPFHVKILTFVISKNNKLFDPLLKKTAIGIMITAILFSIGLII
jgi:1,4-dihydroxy-2-naphthoate octaprenyltransferase